MSSLRASGACPPATPSEAERDWSQLPREALLLIFEKVRIYEVVAAMEKVCRPWRAVAKNDPALWRVVHMVDLGFCFNDLDLVGLAKVGVDRADGKMEAFWADYSCDDELLMHIAERNVNLKSLRLISCYPFSNKGFVEAVKHFPLLEELELTHSKNVFGKVFEQVGRACPQLKHFRLNGEWYDFGESDDDLDAFDKPLDQHDVLDAFDEPLDEDEDEDDDLDGLGEPFDRDAEAMAIAKSMPKLRHVQLIGNQLTDKGVAAILDNCPLLETLDIRCCFNVKLDVGLRAKCENLKTLLLPHDPTDDYGYFTGVKDPENDYYWDDTESGSDEYI